jgi:hypothetical protein
MDIIKVANKESVMDTTEKYHIYIANQNGTQLNGTHTNKHTTGIHYSILCVNTLK